MGINNDNSLLNYEESKVSWATADFVKKPPKFITYLFILFVLFMIISGIIYITFAKTAITIETNGVIQSKIPAIQVSTKTKLIIDKILHKNGTSVSKDDYIVFGNARIENDQYATYKSEVKTIQRFIHHFESNTCDVACINSVKSNYINFFRYLKSSGLKEIILNIRKTIYSILSNMNSSNSIHLNNLKVYLSDFKELVDEFQQSQILKSPKSGKLLIKNNIVRGLYLKPGSVVFEVIPEPYQLSTKSFLTGRDVTRVKLGMPVKISIDAYPSRQYGLINGEISSIPVTASTDPAHLGLYEIQVSLKKQAIQYKNERKPLLIGMKTKALIVIEHSTILKRNLSKIINLD